MDTLLDFYEEILSKDAPFQTYSVLSISVVLFTALCIFITNTCIFSELDKITAKIGYSTVGFKSTLLLFGALYAPVITSLQDIQLGDAVWHHTIVFSITVLCGFCILLKRGKKRVCEESVRHIIFFQTIGTLASPMLGIYPMRSSYSSIFLFALYLIYIVLFSTHRKEVHINLLIDQTTRMPFLASVVDKILNRSKEGSQKEWVSILVSSVTMGTLVGRTFFGKDSILLGIGVFLVLSIFSMQTKKTSLFRNAYSFTCACIILKAVSIHIYSVLRVLFSTAYMTYLGYILITNIYLLFPFCVILAVGMAQKRYKLCFTTALSMPIHVFLFQKAVWPYVYTNPHHLLVLDRITLYSIVFIAISTILLFANNEIRSGLFEVEVGGILLSLYVVYILCILCHPTLSK
ncbi:hypothetical protein NEAUS03_0864 [Nematocida ausubeli]|nr:hypothetical protein NEAUS03_0864 [Nematocida ausubeli]